MGTSDRDALTKAFRVYRAARNKHSSSEMLRDFMPEIIYRTTKLEEEAVTRAMVSELFE